MPYRSAPLRSPPQPRTSGRHRWRATLLALAALAAFVAALCRLTQHDCPVAPSGRGDQIPELHQAAALTDGDGTRYVLRGGTRLAVRLSGVVDVAPVYFETPILWAARVGDGWAFVTMGGDVARSDTFLGAPRPLGRLPCELTDAPYTHPQQGFMNRIAFVDDAGSLWTTDGRAPLRRADVLGRARLVAFADARHGVAVMDDGRLLVTRDGARWSTHPLGGDLAWGLDGGRPGQAVIVDTTAGHLVLDASGDLRHDPSAAPGPVEPWIDLRSLRAHALRVPPDGTPYDAPADRARCDERPPPRRRDYGPRDDELPTFHYACRLGERAPTPPGRDEPAHVDLLGARQAAGPVPWRVEASSSRGSLVSIRRAGTTMMGWAGGEGEVVTLPEPFLAGRGANIDWRVSTIALPDGGLAWVVGEDTRGLGVVGVALDVAPDGAVRGRRPFVGLDQHLLGLVRRGACAGALLGDMRGGAMRWLPTGGGGSRCPGASVVDLPALPVGRSMPPCGAASAADLAIEARGYYRFDFAGISAPADAMSRDQDDHHLSLRFTPAGYCLAHVESSEVAGRRPSAWRMRLDARPSGGLRGHIELADGTTRRVRCEARSPAAHPPEP